MKIIGAVLILLALVIGIAPMFTDCQSQGMSINLPNGKTIPMKCHWTGTAEAAVALPLLVVGILEMTEKSAAAQRSLAVIGVVLGVVVCLLPTVLIGVCGNPEMLCNSLMRPLLILSGILVIVVSLVGLRLALKAGQTAS
jgi:hypothetical protein